jgi:hypothetical protein
LGNANNAIAKTQQESLANPDSVKAESEAERMAWNKIAREDDLEKKAKAAENYLKDFSDGAYAPYAHEIIAVYALGQNEMSKFKQHAEAAVANLSESVMLEVELAKVYAEEQNPEAAIKHAEKVLPVLMTLVASHEEEKAELEERRRSMIADTNYALGTAYLLQGLNSRSRPTITRAIGYLETAVKLNNLDERSHFRLAFGYQVTRQSDRALAEYARAAALEGSNSAMARQYLEKAYQDKHGNLDGLDAFIAEQKNLMLSPPAQP